MSDIFDGSNLDSKLNMALIESLVGTVKTCVGIEVALKLHGISQKEVARWLKLANELPGSIYENFRDSLMKAEAEREKMLTMLLVRAAAQGDTKAVMFMLQQQFPQRWGKMSGAIEQPSNIFAEVETSKPAALPESTSSRIENLPLDKKIELMRLLDGE